MIDEISIAYFDTRTRKPLSLCWQVQVLTSSISYNGCSSLCQRCSLHISTCCVAGSLTFCLDLFFVLLFFIVREFVVHCSWKLIDQHGKHAMHFTYGQNYMKQQTDARSRKLSSDGMVGRRLTLKSTEWFICV